LAFPFSAQIKLTKIEIIKYGKEILKIVREG